MQTRNTDYIYKNDLDKAYFQHDITNGKYKDLTKRTELDKILRDKDCKQPKTWWLSKRISFSGIQVFLIKIHG